MSLFFVRIALLAGTVVLASCGAINTTPAERAASFSPYEKLKVGEISIAEYTLFRYAFLLSAVGLVVDSSEESPELFHIESEKRMKFGSAAAVDRRGYYLTAAHTLSDGPVYLGILNADGKVDKFVHARVVWRGVTIKPRHGFDLAILHIPGPVERVFEWASQVEVGDQVIGGGLDSEYEELSFDGSIVPFGGVVEMGISKTFRGVSYDEICYKGPSHFGDSGGPLVNKDGELIGINFVAARTIFGGESYGYAIRPDLEWLRQVIEEDFAAQ